MARKSCPLAPGGTCSIPSEIAPHTRRAQYSWRVRSSFDSKDSSGSAVALLEKLVAFRTDVALGHERPLADHLARLLLERGADEVSVVDVPRSDGHKSSSYVYARFGHPRLLVNAHLDTVPPNATWSHDPFVARVEEGRVYALGSADTKGAAAAILKALEGILPKNLGILFSGDEEFSSVAMRAFVTSAHAVGVERAIVCEPTNMRVGTRHRGLLSFDVTVTGPGGHSSEADTKPSPIALLSRLAVAFDVWAKSQAQLGPPGFPGMCVNLAKLEGGVAFNVIPAEARLIVSLRPPPATGTEPLWRELEAVALRVVPDATFRRLRDNPPFATKNLGAFEAMLGAACQSPLDLGFWTEAAVLAASGIDAVVLGPGDIAQAHGPDEWVTVRELDLATSLFRSIFAGS